MKVSSGTRAVAPIKLTPEKIYNKKRRGRRRGILAASATLVEIDKLR